MAVQLPHQIAERRHPRRRAFAWRQSLAAVALAGWFGATGLRAETAPFPEYQPATAREYLRTFIRAVEDQAGSGADTCFLQARLEQQLGRRYIVETIASGLGLIDYSRDGLPDILFLNGAPLPGTPQPAQKPGSALYRNNGDGTFSDVTAQSGLGSPGYALSCAVADYDNDGFEDIFITGYGFHRLFHNNGDGTFSDVTGKAGLGKAAYPGCVGAGCVFFDYDRDGRLDLFIGHYLKFEMTDYKPAMRANVPVYANPRSFPPVASLLYHGNTDGTFTDVSEASGIGRYQGYAMGVVSAD